MSGMSTKDILDQVLVQNIVRPAPFHRTTTRERSMVTAGSPKHWQLFRTVVRLLPDPTQCTATIQASNGPALLTSTTVGAHPLISLIQVNTCLSTAAVLINEEAGRGWPPTAPDDQIFLTVRLRAEGSRPFLFQNPGSSSAAVSQPVKSITWPLWILVEALRGNAAPVSHRVVEASMQFH